jgi:hypothetical protein
MAFMSGSVGKGIAFLIGAATVAEFIAKDVSSPQTVHINASKRAPTLMKWVHVGQVEAIAFLVIAAVIDPTFAGAFIAGGLLEMAITEAEYLYAKQSGLKNPGPPTEQYPPTESYGYGGTNSWSMGAA